MSDDDAPPVAAAADSAPSDLRLFLAEFVLQHASYIRAIARRKLSAGTKTVFDSEDVVSSVARRLDALAAKGQITRGTDLQLLVLVRLFASRNAVNKTRLIERSRAFVEEDGEYARMFLNRLNACGDDDDAGWLVYRMAISLTDERDRQLFLLRVRGAASKAAAGMLGLTADAARQRWCRICQSLRERFGQEPNA